MKFNELVTIISLLMKEMANLPSSNIDSSMMDIMSFIMYFVSCLFSTENIIYSSSLN